MTSPKKTTLLTLLSVFLLAATALAVSYAKQPLDIAVKAQIDIYQRTGGSWTKIDSVGPETIRVQASLLEAATSKSVESRFHWQTTSKQGKPYSVRLLDVARLRYDPRTGSMNANLRWQIGYDGQDATVSAQLGTGSVQGPSGSLRGANARGLLGKERVAFTMVSSNSFKQADGKELQFVAKEEYAITPAKR